MDLHQPWQDNPWSAPRLWPDSTVFILANGPTLGILKDRKDYRNALTIRHVIAVNSAFYIGDFVDVLFFGDAKWYWWNKNAVQAFKGLKVTLNLVSRGVCKFLDDEPGLHIMNHGGLRGLHADPAKLAWNRSSGGAAINLAVHLGASRIILFGYDMQLVNGEKNCFLNEQECTKMNPYENMRADKIWSQVMASAKKFDIEILNATPDSALELVPKVNLEDYL